MANREVRCQACGTLNRVRRYSVRRIPQCGKCHTNLPETGPVRTLRKFYTHGRLLQIVRGQMTKKGGALLIGLYFVAACAFGAFVQFSDPLVFVGKVAPWTQAMGLATGTSLSVGTPLGLTAWQMLAADVGNALVYAPKDFVGIMVAAIDLRSPGDWLMDSQIVRLEWIQRKEERSAPQR